MQQKKDGVLDAQICEQQEGKREARLTTGFGVDLCFQQLGEQDYGKQVIKKTQDKNRDTREPEGCYRQEQAPEVC